MFSKAKGLSRLVKLLLVLIALLPVWYFLWERQHQAGETGQEPVLQERCEACGLQVPCGPKQKPASQCPRCGREGTVVLILAEPAPQPLASTDFALRIGVGIVSFLAVVVLIVRGDRRGKVAEREAPENWVACLSCGGFVRAKPAAEGIVASCPECGEEVSPSAPGVSAEAVEDQEINAYMQALIKARQDRLGK
jgi:hypothetical protein